MTYLTFAQWQASKQEMTPAQAIEAIGDLGFLDSAQSDFSLLIYGGSYWIERYKGGVLNLHIEIQEWQAEEKDLPQLELRLWHYAYSIDIAEHAAQSDNLDSACSIVQEAIGQTDGGIAGIVFSDIEESSWAAMDNQEQIEKICEYLETEIRYHPAFADFDNPMELI